MNLIELAAALVLTFCVMQVFEIPPLRSWRPGRLFALGVAGVTLTAYLGFILYVLVTASPLVVDFGGSGYCLLQILLIGFVALAVWLTFYRVLRSGELQK